MASGLVVENIGAWLLCETITEKKWSEHVRVICGFLLVRGSGKIARHYKPSCHFNYTLALTLTLSRVVTERHPTRCLYKQIFSPFFLSPTFAPSTLSFLLFVMAYECLICKGRSLLLKPDRDKRPNELSESNEPTPDGQGWPKKLAVDFDTPDLLAVHYKKEHRNHNHRCDVCLNFFSSKNVLDMHLFDAHSIVSERRLKAEEEKEKKKKKKKKKDLMKKKKKREVA